MSRTQPHPDSGVSEPMGDPSHPALSHRPRWLVPTLLVSGAVITGSISAWALWSARGLEAKVSFNARAMANDVVAAAHPGEGPNGWDTFIEATTIANAIGEDVHLTAERLAELRLLYPGQTGAVATWGYVDVHSLLEPQAVIPPEPTVVFHGASGTSQWKLGPDVSVMEHYEASCDLYADQLLAHLTLREFERRGLDELLDQVAATPRLVRTFEGDGPLVEALIPELSPARRLAQMESVRMQLALRDGRTEDALRAFEHALAIGRAVAFQATLIDRLVAIAIYELMLDPLDVWLTDAPPDRETLLRIGAILREQALIGSHATWIATERLTAEDIVQRVYSDDGEGDGMLVVSEFGWLNDMVSPSPAPSVDGRWFNAAGALAPSRKETLDAFATFYTNLEQSLARDKSGAAQAEVLSVDEVLMASDNMFVQLLAPAVSKACANINGTEQHIQMTRIEVALEAYRAEHGVYPPTLAHLAPILGEVPADPLTGKPFAYTPPEDPSAEGRVYVLAVPGFTVVPDSGGSAPASTAPSALAREKAREKAANSD